MSGVENTIPICGVVLVAAGRGERVGGALPKQFQPLAGEPLLMHSLRVFLGAPFVRSIVLVLPAAGPPPWLATPWRGLDARIIEVAGGARRQDSVAAGLAALPEGVQVALVHDAARPFPPVRAVADLARAALELGGGLLAQRAIDTIKLADAGGCVRETLDRNSIWLAQTPQALRADFLPRAIAAFTGPTDYTDEAMLLEAWGVPVRLIDGGPGNFKVTNPGDLDRAAALLATATPPPPH